MNTRFFILLFLISFTVNAQQRYVDSLFTDITSGTYTYAVKDSMKLQLDFYQPKIDTLKKRPLFVFVHGGGFASGRKDHPEIVKLAKQVAARGYVVASLSYRLTRKGKSFGCDCPAQEKINTFRAASEDITDAISYLLSKPETFRVDAEKIILTGSSAGAEGILNIAYNEHPLFRELPNNQVFKPAAVISLAGAILDARYITAANVIPGIFFHGTADPLVPYGSAAHHFCKPTDPGYLMLDGSATIVHKLHELHTSYLFYTFEGANHDVFKIPFKRLQEIFSFMHKVVFQEKLYQAKITVNKGE